MSLNHVNPIGLVIMAAAVLVNIIAKKTPVKVAALLLCAAGAGIAILCN